MTVAELAKVSERPLKVMSSFNGKVLCHRFKEDKHQEIGAREVMAVWPEISVTNSGFSSHAVAILCVYADGHKEAANHFGFTEVREDGE